MGNSNTFWPSLFQTNFTEIGPCDEETFIQHDTFPVVDWNSAATPTGDRASMPAAKTILSTEKSAIVGFAEVSVCENEKETNIERTRNPPAMNAFIHTLL